MSTLDSLIRINKYTLDERRRELAELENRGERLRCDSLDLDNEVVREQQSAAGSSEFARAYAGYARRVIDLRAKLTAALADVETQITAAREAVSDSFREIKRFEITAANRAARERVAEDRKQLIVQDEVAAQIHRRRSDG